MERERTPEYELEERIINDFTGKPLAKGSELYRCKVKETYKRGPNRRHVLVIAERMVGPYQEPFECEVLIAKKWIRRGRADGERRAVVQEGDVFPLYVQPWGHKPQIQAYHDSAYTKKQRESAYQQGVEQRIQFLTVAFGPFPGDQIRE